MLSEDKAIKVVFVRLKVGDIAFVTTQICVDCTVNKHKYNHVTIQITIHKQSTNYYSTSFFHSAAAGAIVLASVGDTEACSAIESAVRNVVAHYTAEKTF